MTRRGFVFLGISLFPMAAMAQHGHQHPHGRHHHGHPHRHRGRHHHHDRCDGFIVALYLDQAQVARTVVGSHQEAEAYAQEAIATGQANRVEISNGCDVLMEVLEV